MGYANGESPRLFVAIRISAGNQEELCQSKDRRLKAVGVYMTIPISRHAFSCFLVVTFTPLQCHYCHFSHTADKRKVELLGDRTHVVQGVVLCLTLTDAMS